MDKIILHIDVNSAYLSWSALKLLNSGYKKDIRNEIAVVAGNPKKRHGVIVAASIPAKKIGIRPPTNLYEARKIYNNLIIVEPDFKFYKMCSNNLINFLKDLFPTVEQYSIDECYVNYTEVKRKYGNEIDFAYKLKDEIYNRFGFTVNIGIGNSKLCAKMASDFEKPNKVHTLYDTEFKEKMWNKDISDLFMAGKSSCKKLRELGINTIGQLANYDKNKLILKMKSQGKLLHEYANGIDNSNLNSESYNNRKSISYSRTLENSTDNKAIILKYLKVFSKDISYELHKKNLYAKIIFIIIRDDNFKTSSKQEKLLNSIYEEDEIYNYGKKLLDEHWDGEKIRLIGLGVTDFSDNYVYQFSLFDNNKKIEKDKNTDKLIDELNDKLGSNVVIKANELKKDNK